MFEHERSLLFTSILMLYPNMNLWLLPNVLVFDNYQRQLLKLLFNRTAVKDQTAVILGDYQDGNFLLVYITGCDKSILLVPDQF